MVLALWALYVIVGSIFADQFTPTATIGQLIVDFPIRLLPNGYLYIIEPAFEPTAGVGRFMADWIPVIVWVVILLGLLRSFVAARVESDAGDRAKARALLEQNGITALAYLTTWEGNSYWFSADGDSFVAYRVEGGVAITTGDPVGSAGGPGDARWRSSSRSATRENWTPCLYSTTEAVKEVTDGFGWPSLQVAEETVLPLGKLAFTGKKFQDIRTSISRAGKGGITAEWIYYSEAPLAIRDQIQAISEEWVSDKALPEMGFTLGGLDELDDPAVRCLIAIDQDRTIHGITSWMPCYRDGVPGRLDPGLHAPPRRGVQGRHGIPDRHRGAGPAEGGRRVRQPVRCAAGAGEPRRGAGRGAEAARGRSARPWSRCTASARCCGSRPSSSPCTSRCSCATRKRPCCPGSASASRTPTCPT